jgi:hypothetical protein
VSTCTDSLVCGGTPAACECPKPYPVTKLIVDPTNSTPAWRPSGTTQPGCSFDSLTDALAAVPSGGTTYLPIYVQGATAKPEWTRNTTFGAGSKEVSPIWPNGHWYTSTTGGTTGATEPAWCTTTGCTVTDGTTTWKESGTTKGIDLKNETFPIVIKGRVRVYSGGCEFATASNCLPNAYVIRFTGPSVYAAVDVAAIGAIPDFRGFRVANDSVTPPAAMVKTSSGSVGLDYVEAYCDSDVNPVKAATGFLAAGPSSDLRFSNARHCSGYGAVVTSNVSFASDAFFDNDGGGISITGGNLSLTDALVFDNGGPGISAGSFLTLTRGHVWNNAGDGVQATSVYTHALSGATIDHNGGAGVRVQAGSTTLTGLFVFRNAGGGIVFPAGSTSATLGAFQNDQVYCNVGPQIAFYAPQAGGAAYDLSGGDTACGMPSAASLIYGYGGGLPGTMGVLNDPANAAGVNASWISWGSGGAAPASGVDFSGLTSAQSTAASTQFCSFAPPACPP